MSHAPSKPYRLADINPLLLLLLLALLLTLLLALLPASVHASDFKVANARVTAPVSWENPSVYFVIQNPDSKARTIVGGSCEGCDWIEIHRTVFEDGVMTSEKLEEMAIPAGGALAFAPRGLFLSLIGLTEIKGADEGGAKFSIELEFADGEKLEIEAAVDDD
jgi:copper(I)-binding protein